MAIAFLDDINLNDNQAENLVIQRIATLPTGVEAKIVYDNASNTIKYYNGTGWIELDGAGGISGSGTVGTVPVFVTNTTTLGDSQLITTGSGNTQNFIFNTGGLVGLKGNLSVDQGGIYDGNSSLGTSGQLLSSTGTKIEWINAPVSYTKWVLTGDTGTQDITDGNTVLVAGGTNITTEVTATDTVTINLDDNVTLAGDLTVTGGDITLGGTGRIQGVDTVSAATDAVNKDYVDNLVVGNLIFQGGYDAANNSPDLDSSPSASIKKGWSYVVTVAGNFFTEAVEVGDFLIAQQDAPTTLANWVTVQNNVGLATASTVGIGNVNVNGLGDLDGLKVSYSSGTATVGVDIKNNASTFTALNEMLFLVYDGADTATNLALPIESLATYVNANTGKQFVGTSSSATTHTFNHNLNSFNVIVQLYDTSTKETVYASVDRTSVNQVVATTAAAASLTCLIDKIG